MCLCVTSGNTDSEDQLYSVVWHGELGRPVLGVSVCLCVTSGNTDSEDQLLVGTVNSAGLYSVLVCVCV